MQLPIIAMNFALAVRHSRRGPHVPPRSRAIDVLTPEVNFHEELKKGNIAVAIFIAALFISIGLIVGRALN